MLRNVNAPYGPVKPHQITLDVPADTTSAKYKATLLYATDVFLEYGALVLQLGDGGIAEAAMARFVDSVPELRPVSDFADGVDGRNWRLGQHRGLVSEPGYPVLSLNPTGAVPLASVTYEPALMRLRIAADVIVGDVVAAVAGTVFGRKSTAYVHQLMDSYVEMRPPEMYVDEDAYDLQAGTQSVGDAHMWRKKNKRATRLFVTGWVNLGDDTVTCLYHAGSHAHWSDEQQRSELSTAEVPRGAVFVCADSLLRGAPKREPLVRHARLQLAWCVARNDTTLVVPSIADDIRALRTPPAWYSGVPEPMFTQDTVDGDGQYSGAWKTQMLQLPPSRKRQAEDELTRDAVNRTGVVAGPPAGVSEGSVLRGGQQDGALPLPTVFDVAENDEDVVVANYIVREEDASRFTTPKAAGDAP